MVELNPQPSAMVKPGNYGFDESVYDRKIDVIPNIGPAVAAPIEAPQTEFRPIEKVEVPQAQEQTALTTNNMVAPVQRTQGEFENKKQGSMLSVKPVMGTQFGVAQAADKYSGGVNYGTDIIVPRGTAVSAPPGEWVVADAFSGATVEGPNNSQGGINKGYGNSVVLVNKKTGEKLRFSHLMAGGVGVKKGDTLSGGQVFARTGASGNTAGRTGQHLDLEYYRPDGQIDDVRKSQYWGYIAGE